MQGFLYRVLCGFLLGISIFAPGFSASMLAIVMGIYQRLLAIVANPFRDLKQNIAYLFPMGIGALLSLIFFVLLFDYLFAHYETATYLLFVGLIAGNLPPLLSDAKKMQLRARDIAIGAAALCVALAVGVAGGGASDMPLTAQQHGTLFLLACGVIAGAAALVPGISVSLILMALGTYHFLIQSAKMLDIGVILTVGIAFVAGIVLFARIIRLLFRRFPRACSFAVLGFMTGSLGGLCASLPVQPGFSWWTGLLAVALGLGLSVLFYLFGKRHKGMEQIS